MSLQRFYLSFGSSLIGIISISSIVVIYTTFKMSYWDRIKDFGTLTSLGMDRKQMNKMLKTEAKILGGISLPVGISLGILISNIIITIVKVLISKTLNDNFAIITINKNVELNLQFPFIIILLNVLVVYMIIFISSKLPIKKIENSSPIEVIQNTISSNIKRKQVSSPKIIEKFFKEEGILAYKNIKRDKSKHKTITFSLIISMVLFLTISGFIDNLYGKEFSRSEYNDYQLLLIDTDEKEINELINNLKNQKLIGKYFTFEILSKITISLGAEDIDDTMKKAIKDNVYNVKNGSIDLTINSFYLEGDAYDDILEKAGIEELKEGEVIISNSIPKETKYGKVLKFANFEKGDKYTSIYKGKEMTFTVAGIVDDFGNYIETGNIIEPNINQIVNEETAKKMQISELQKFIYINIDTNKTKELENAINRINETKTNYEPPIIGNNLYETRLSEESQKNITKTLLYSFVILFSAISILNIFNTIQSSIYLRKKEISMLRAIGMSNTQLKKMLVLECIFYGFDAILYSVILSLFILYVMHLFMVDTKLYSFSIPLINIAFASLVMYIVVFIAMNCAKRKTFKNNIISEIRTENI